MTYRSLDEGRKALLDQLHNVETGRAVVQWAASNFAPAAFNDVSRFMHSRCLNISSANLRVVFRQTK